LRNRSGARGTGFRDHFSAAAAGYAAFRPTYPDELFDWLAGLSPGRALAWDAGTGNGQAARALAERFEHVLASDASPGQIEHALPHARVEYRVARAEASGLADGTCDLVTAAQALHWFDIPAFFAESRRVLRPAGVCAVWTYTMPTLDHQDCDALLQRYLGEVDAYWPPERHLVDTGYRTVAFPFEEVAAPALILEMRPALGEFTGYVRTWSASQRCGQAIGHDPVDEFEARLTDAWPAGARLRLHWPLHVRAGKR
jgi:SAM-dependent methyltransferase